MRNTSRTDHDLRVLWHPCSQMKDHAWLAMIPIRREERDGVEGFEGIELASGD